MENKRNGVINMKSRFTEEHIIKILKEHEQGEKAAEIVRENNIFEKLLKPAAIGMSI